VALLLPKRREVLERGSAQMMQGTEFFFFVLDANIHTALIWTGGKKFMLHCKKKNSE
jgi:hypothetical protein